MLGLIYPVVESEREGHVTDGLPRVGFRTLLIAIALALVIAFGGHYLLKQFVRANAFSGDTLPATRNDDKCALLRTSTWHPPFWSHHSILTFRRCRSSPRQHPHIRPPSTRFQSGWMSHRSCPARSPATFRRISLWGKSTCTLSVAVPKTASAFRRANNHS